MVDQTRFERVIEMMREAKEAKITSTDIPQMVELAAADYGLNKAEGSGVLDHLIRGGDLSLYGLSNAITRAAQDVESYDRSTEMESIGGFVQTVPAQATVRMFGLPARAGLLHSGSDAPGYWQLTMTAGSG